MSQPKGARTRKKRPTSRYRGIHDGAIVIDTHADTFGRVLDEHQSFLGNSNELSVSLPRMFKGGLDAEVFALYIEPGLPPGCAMKRLLAMAGTLFEAIASSRGRLVLVQTATELRRVVATGKKCALLAIEGGHVIDNDLNVLRALRRLGVICMTLTHANSNDWADSSQGETRWGGLNDLGRRVVREMNRLGMLVDVSHASDETVECVLETSSMPVIASHSCCRSICDHPRNLTDDLIKKIAKDGGLIDIAYYPPFLDSAAASIFEANWARLGGGAILLESDGQQGRVQALYQQCAEGIPDVGIDTLCAHIDHVASLVGPEHVGIGSDWDGSTSNVKGLETCATLPLLTKALLARGYRPREIRLILGENFLRVLATVETAGSRG